LAEAETGGGNDKTTAESKIAFDMPTERDLSEAVIRQEFTHCADNFFQMRFECEVAGW
jgi:hypothetical protein